MRWPTFNGDLPDFSDFESLKSIEITTPESEWIGEAEHGVQTQIAVAAWQAEERKRELSRLVTALDAFRKGWPSCRD